MSWLRATPRIPPPYALRPTVSVVHAMQNCFVSLIGFLPPYLVAFARYLPLVTARHSRNNCLSSVDGLQPQTCASAGALSRLINRFYAGTTRAQKVPDFALFEFVAGY